jgi:hypothetical protein
MSSKKTINSVLVGFAILSLIAAGIYGYLYLGEELRNQQEDEQSGDRGYNDQGYRDSEQNDSSENTEDSEEQSEDNTDSMDQNDSANQDDSKTDQQSKECTDFLLVKGDVTEAERVEICTKVIEPAILYYSSLEDEDLVSIEVEPLEDTNNFAYSGVERTTESADMTWLFGYKGESVSDVWWHPKCETGFSTPEFTAEFEQEYPDIVKYCGQ